jgi:hypothetical protein
MRYGENAQTTVYRSKDPLNFGVDDDRFRIGTLLVAAPEIVEHAGQLYIAALMPTLKGSDSASSVLTAADSPLLRAWRAFLLN